MMTLFFICSLLLHDELKTDEKSKLDLILEAPSISKEKISQLMISLLYKELGEFLH